MRQQKKNERRDQHVSFYFQELHLNCTMKEISFVTEYQMFRLAKILEDIESRLIE